MVCGRGDVLGDGGVDEVVTEKGELGLDPRRSPEWVVAAQAANEGADRGRNLGPARLAGLPGPVVSEALPVPANHGLRLDDHEGGLPAGPETRQQHPEEPVAPAEFRARLGALINCQLLPQRQTFRYTARAGHE